VLLCVQVSNENVKRVKEIGYPFILVQQGEKPLYRTPQTTFVPTIHHQQQLPIIIIEIHHHENNPNIRIVLVLFLPHGIVGTFPF
jgi:hypothetical protein